MTTVFEILSDGFYTAFFQPDTEKRKEGIETWFKESTPVIQSAVESELRECFEKILKDTWTLEGWKPRVQKFSNSSFMDTYNLSLDIKFSSCTSKNKDKIEGPLTPEVREKTNAAAETAKWTIAKLEPPSPIPLREIDVHGYHVNEALPIIGKFLEECYRDNVRQVRIIHGKGIFVLQKAIREYLGTHKLVIPESIASANKDQGGEGATEANLVEFSANA